MENFIPSFLSFVVACVGVCFLVAAIPFVLWYYYRAKEIAPLLTRKAALETVIQNLQKDIQVAREELDKLAQDKVAAQELIKQGELAKKWQEANAAKLEDLCVQVARMKEEFEVAKTQLEDAMSKVSDKRNELADLNKKLLTVEERIANDEKTHQEKVDQIDQKAAEIKECVEKLTSERNLLQEERDSLDREVSELEESRVELMGLVEKLEKDIQEKTDSLRTLVENKNRELENELSRKRKSFEDEIAQRRKALEDELQGRRDRFSADVEKQTREIAAIREKQIEEIGNEIKRLEARRDSMQKEIAEYEVKRQKNQDLKDQNADLARQRDSLLEQLESAKIKIAEADALRVNEANMWKDLERPVARIIEEPVGLSSVSDEDEALAGFINALKASHYSFSERTVKAFHTGLLCGGVSPLVVLSGVSGTGKSLLPELYAKVFNMNFLPVAVQPRWDGPQDVFGFYNHMEKRFKATELSRLLWQFDIFNNREANIAYGDDLSGLPMSVVLLDEMNLARVEYYFSELLSKLEIRNHIIEQYQTELDIPKDVRFSSEVELEYGASSVTDSKMASLMARRFYVGKNILLVGTMNEDESTQSLSSKVVDRSNVLRFGTPDSLRVPVEPKKLEEFCDNFVSYGTWLKWARPKGGNLPHIDDYIKALKDTLKQVDRGFGHRTETAIKRYVEFYPGSKEDALADQIEMKVLTKLNGVEADLVSSRVQGGILDVLQEIHDTEVSNALRDSLKGDNSFFTWKGVRR